MVAFYRQHPNDFVTLQKIYPPYCYYYWMISSTIILKFSEQQTVSCVIAKLDKFTDD